MPIAVIATIKETREALKTVRRGGPVVLVPTMGALHEGHAALVRQAREQAGAEGKVVVSIFVNPTQFGPNEDFEAYPRALEHDLTVCEKNGADFALTPSVAEMYPPQHSIEVRETKLSRGLCGMSRPVHFPGVCLVVAKLFGIVQPDKAIFGKKDYQQLAVIRRMVRDLCMPVEIVASETVREADGLALSSRNQYLSVAERNAAPGIHAALQAGKERWEQHPGSASTVLTRFVRSRLEQLPNSHVDYLELVDAETLEPVNVIAGKVVLATAVCFGRARLIDNIEFGPDNPA